MSNSLPAVSVVVASYNAVDFLEEAVRSVLSQTLPDIEVIVVDDGSEDATPQLAARFADDGRVRWVRQENQGQASAKNRGISLARAPIVGFCDADDAWHPRKLEWQLPLFERPEVGVVYSREQRFVDRPEGRVPVPGSDETPHRGRVTEPLFIENFVPFGTALVRRGCLEECGGFDESHRMGIDWDLWLRISLRHEFDFTDQTTYYYRVWPGQMSSNWRGRYAQVIPMMQDFLARHPGVISPAVRRRAWAHTFVNRGRMRATCGGEVLPAWADVARAIGSDPLYPGAWRMIPWMARATFRHAWEGRA